MGVHLNLTPPREWRSTWLGITFPRSYMWGKVNVLTCNGVTFHFSHLCQSFLTCPYFASLAELLLTGVLTCPYLSLPCCPYLSLRVLTLLSLPVSLLFYLFLSLPCYIYLCLPFTCVLAILTCPYLSLLSLPCCPYLTAITCVSLLPVSLLPFPIFFAGKSFKPSCSSFFLAHFSFP